MGRVEGLVTPLAEVIGEQLGYEVVDVIYAKEGGDSVLRVTIDQPNGISSNDCERFSRALDAKLDEVDPISGSYLLEVSSPGLDRPLKKPADFERFAGEKVEVRLHTKVMEKKQWKGKLVGWTADNDGAIILETDGQTITLPWSAVSRVRLSPDW